MPKSDSTKFSLPGEFKVVRDVLGVPIVYPEEIEIAGHNELEMVYDHGKCCEWDDFDTVRLRVNEQYHQLPSVADPISRPLKEKITRVVEAQQQVNSARA